MPSVSKPTADPATPEPDPDNQDGTESDAPSQTVFLVRSATTGNQQAFADLYSRHHDRVWNSARRRLGRNPREAHQDLEEAVQDTFAYAFGKIAKGEFDPQRTEGGLRNWLATIVVNKIRDQARRRGAIKRGADTVQQLEDLTDGASIDSFLAGTAVTPSAIMRGKEAERRLEELILQLPEQQRLVLDLRDGCGMSFDEVAVEIGYDKTVTVRSIYKRAKDTLQEQLAAER